jgi:hypothetical protein
MPLSCGCDYESDFDPGDWMYDFEASPHDFETLKTNRAKRCCSCKGLIKVGDICIVYHRCRYPYTDIESKIRCGCVLDDCFSDPPSIRVSPHYHCERCGEIWLNLTDIGYECLGPYENMPDALEEYHSLSGFVARFQAGIKTNE